MKIQGNTNFLHYLKKIFAKKKVFFSAFMLFLFTSLIFLVAYGKSDSFIILNFYHSYLLNIFFIYYTNFGDGIFSLILSLVLFFVLKKKKMALAIFISFLSSGIFIQIIKNIVAEARPKLFFEHNQLSFFINDVTLSSMNSFPSGHTTSAFATATALVIFQKGNALHFFIIMLAMLVGYSRIYLSQHFLGDVLAGAFIGTSFGIVCSWLITKSKYKFLQ